MKKKLLKIKKKQTGSGFFDNLKNIINDKIGTDVSILNLITNYENNYANSREIVNIVNKLIDNYPNSYNKNEKKIELYNILHKINKINKKIYYSNEHNLVKSNKYLILSYDMFNDKKTPIIQQDIIYPVIFNELININKNINYNIIREIETSQQLNIYHNNYNIKNGYTYNKQKFVYNIIYFIEYYNNKNSSQQFINQTNIESSKTDTQNPISTTHTLPKPLNNTYKEDSSKFDINNNPTNITQGLIEDPKIQGTNVQGTNVQGTNAQETNVQGTNVQGTNAQETNVQGTNLEGTNVQGTNAQATNVQGTNVQDSIYSQNSIKLSDINLQQDSNSNKTPEVSTNSSNNYRKSCNLDYRISKYNKVNRFNNINNSSIYYILKKISILNLNKYLYEYSNRIKQLDADLKQQFLQDVTTIERKIYKINKNHNTYNNFDVLYSILNSDQVYIYKKIILHNSIITNNNTKKTAINNENNITINDDNIMGTDSAYGTNYIIDIDNANGILKKIKTLKYNKIDLNDIYELENLNYFRNYLKNKVTQNLPFNYFNGINSINSKPNYLLTINEKYDNDLKNFILEELIYSKNDSEYKYNLFLNSFDNIIISLISYWNIAKINHSDMHAGNVLFKKCNATNAYFHYNIYGKNIYIKNYGYLWTIWDYGLQNNFSDVIKINGTRYEYITNSHNDILRIIILYKMYIEKFYIKNIVCTVFYNNKLNYKYSYLFESLLIYMINSKKIKNDFNNKLQIILQLIHNFDECNIKKIFDKFIKKNTVIVDENKEDFFNILKDKYTNPEKSFKNNTERFKFLNYCNNSETRLTSSIKIMDENISDSGGKKGLRYRKKNNIVNNCNISIENEIFDFTLVKYLEKVYDDYSNKDRAYSIALENRGKELYNNIFNKREEFKKLFNNKCKINIENINKKIINEYSYLQRIINYISTKIKLYQPFYKIIPSVYDYRNFEHLLSLYASEIFLNKENIKPHLIENKTPYLIGNGELGKYWLRIDVAIHKNKISQSNILPKNKELDNIIENNITDLVIKNDNNTFEIKNKYIFINSYYKYNDIQYYVPYIETYQKIKELVKLTSGGNKK